MNSNVRTILSEVNARIKLAEAKLAEDPSNFDAFPGAENDKPVNAETKKPDPEVKEEGPASRTNTTGASAGSDDKVNQDHLYEADESILTPEKKPAESADANAKTASENPEIAKVASEILTILKGAMTKKEAGCCKGSECGGDKKTVKKEEKAAEGGTPEEKAAAEKAAAEKAAAEKAAAAENATAEKTAAEKTTEKKVEKRAKDDMVALGAKILDKIAEARKTRLAKEAGAKDAKAVIKAAEEYNRGAKDAELLIQKLAQALEESANSGEDAETGTPEEAGAADAAAAVADAAGAAGADAGAEAGAEADLDNVTPEEVVQAVNELVEEGQISPEDAATLAANLGGDATGAEGDAGADITEEDLAQGIAQAVDEGNITEDEAQQLAQELVSAGADETLTGEVTDTGAGAEGGAAAAATPEDAGAADAAAAVEDAKQAEAKEAAAKQDKVTKIASAVTEIVKAARKATVEKKAEDEEVARYQRGFIQKCAELGVDPQKVAQYIQAKTQATK